MNKTKGFTIIELIVVIAIIAVLAAIVAINVTSYINKSKDAAIKENLSSMQTAATAMVESGVNYSDVCTNTTSGSAAARAAASAISPVTCNDTDTQWCACAQEKANTSNFFCVSESKKYEGSGNCLGASYCASATAPVCP